MNYLQVALVSGQPLLIDVSHAQSVIEHQGKLMAQISPEKAGVDVLASLLGSPAKPEKIGKVGVIPIKGAIGQNLMPIEKMFGMVDVNDVKRQIFAFEQDPQVKHILFDIDSPGGTVTGVPELAQQIRTASKPTTSFTDSRALSAGFWIGSQATRFIATPSASVGSVGVYRVIHNSKEAHAKQGVEVKVFKSGKHKAIGLPGTALDPESEALIQSEVEDIHADFKADVKSRRSMVPDSAMEGQSFSAKKASQLGMITGISSGIDQVIAELNR